MKMKEVTEGIKGGLAGAGVGALVGKTPKAAMLGYQLGSGAENLLKKKKKKKEPEDVNETTTTSGLIGGVNVPVAPIQRRIPKNGLDSDNLMGGKKKKPKSKKA